MTKKLEHNSELIKKPNQMEVAKQNENNRHEFDDKVVTDVQTHVNDEYNQEEENIGGRYLDGNRTNEYTNEIPMIKPQLCLIILEVNINKNTL